MPTTASRPLIGLTAYRQTTAWWSWKGDAALVPGGYLDLVEVAGGRPLVLPPSGGPTDSGGPQVEGAAVTAPSPAGPGEDLDGLLAVLDGLVLTGGGDLDPATYGQAPDARNAGVNPNRDQLELGLVRAAVAADLPVLAVCRGLQVLNVALGGDLVQHLPDRLGRGHRPEPGTFGAVRITTEPGSIVARLLGERADVRCSHHQAIGRVAPGLGVTARSDDGVVEAVELADRRFVVGVQWHPEEDGDARLFEALVTEAARTAGRPRPAHRSEPVDHAEPPTVARSRS